jgi:sulfate transport system ATP-binding protein
MKSMMKKVGDETKDQSARDVPPQTAACIIGISKRFGKTLILEDINFDVAEGEILVLLGASGSGKTTILRIIAGLEEPDTGSVILHQKDVTDLPARERGVGVIFQSYALFPKMNVEKNIGYGLKIRHHSRKDRKKRVEELLALVKLEEHRKKYPSQLSGGQQQRVAIARTLAYKPGVLLFDEPFGALDAQTRGHLRREIRALLKKVNVPAIFITHDQEEALELGDRIAVLNAGHLEQIGTPAQIYNHPATEYVATFLGAANVLRSRVQQGRIKVGGMEIAAPDEQRFPEGSEARLIFRPEDVSLSAPGNAAGGHCCFAGVVQEVNFVGAFERVKVGLVGPKGLADATMPEESSGTRDTIMATLAKPEANALKLKVGDRVTVGLTSYTLLPGPKPSDSR